MNLFARMILVVVLTVFAAGSVVHAAGATAMALDMTMSETTDMGLGDMSPGDCDACGDEDGTLTATCDLVCSTAGFAAVPASHAPELEPTTHDLRQRFTDVTLSGVDNLPLRDPPRSIL
jgi:hypothetical protein